MSLSGLFFRSYIATRLKSGKEDPERISERKGKAKTPRPQGFLIWFHAASVGESLSILKIIEETLKLAPDIHIMVTTGTVTSAELMQKRLPERAFHQYMPIDRPTWVARFLDHWKPDLAIWTESEFWPNILMAIKNRKIPSMLINARMSPRSFRNWKIAPKFIRELLGVFDICLAQSHDEADRLITLGAKKVLVSGNIKYDADILPVDSKALDDFKKTISGRPVWQMSSTHAGEEEQAVTVHKMLKKELEDILTVIIPRHPARGDEIATMIRAEGLNLAQRSKNEPMTKDTEIYLADTLGELGLFYRAVPLCCIGGSLIPHGGHNPIEPAALDCTILYGPHMHNFKAICHDFETAKAVVKVDNADELAEKIKYFFTHKDEGGNLKAKAKTVVEKNAKAAEIIMDHISTMIKKAKEPS